MSSFALVRIKTDRRVTNSGAPAVSKRWAAMVPTPAEALTDEQTLLLKSVQAEDTFSFGGSRDQDVHEISGLNVKLVPTSDGLPDPRVQQALLNPEGSQHSPSERRARNEHAKALGSSAKTDPSSCSSSSSAPSGAPRGQVASQPNFTALIECCCGDASFIADESIKAGLKTIRLTENSNPIGTDAGDAAAHRIVKSLAAEGHKIHMWASLPCRVGSQQSKVLLQSFFKLADAVTRAGGTWSFEWPTSATGWSLPELTY